MSELLIFLLMIVIFAGSCFFLKLPVGIALLLSSVGGALAGGFGVPVKFMVEGTMSFLDTILVIACAMIFMKCIQYSGALDMLNRFFLRRFHNHKVILLLLLMLIDVTVDLHEASPEYPVINALIAHERAMNLASNVVVDMQMEGVQISLEPSPTDLRGLTHRELGDHTDTLALLMEAPNPAQGRLRDRTDEALVLTGKSETYVKAGEIGQLYVPYDENGWPIEVRCARHVFGIERILANYSEMYEEPIIVTGMPSYDELVKNGMGPYLNEPTT